MAVCINQSNHSEVFGLAFTVSPDKSRQHPGSSVNRSGNTNLSVAACGCITSDMVDNFQITCTVLDTNTQENP